MTADVPRGRRDVQRIVGSASFAQLTFAPRIPRIPEVVVHGGAISRAGGSSGNGNVPLAALPSALTKATKQLGAVCWGAGSASERIERRDGGGIPSSGVEVPAGSGGVASRWHGRHGVVALAPGRRRAAGRRGAPPRQTTALALQAGRSRVPDPQRALPMGTIRPSATRLGNRTSNVISLNATFNLGGALGAIGATTLVL